MIDTLKLKVWYILLLTLLWNYMNVILKLLYQLNNVSYICTLRCLQWLSILCLWKQLGGDRLMNLQVGISYTIGEKKGSLTIQRTNLILRWILLSILHMGNTELINNTLPFTGKSRWYDSLMPWLTKAEPWLDGKLIRKIGRETNTFPVPPRTSFMSVFKIILLMKWLPALSLWTSSLSSRCQRKISLTWSLCDWRC